MSISALPILDRVTRENIDALLINSRRPHAVIPGKDDERLANTMFIGSNGAYPLRIWT
jgi:hypothetical protein